MPKWLTGRREGVLLAVLLLIGVGTIYFFKHLNITSTFSSGDKNFSVTTNGVRGMTFKNPSISPQNLPASKVIGGADIVADGEPSNTKITAKFNPADLDKSSDTQVYLSVWEPKLGRAIPLLDSTVNPKTHTVSASAPHFSNYFVNVLQQGKQLIDIAGRQVEVIVDQATTIASFAASVTAKVATDVFKKAFAIAPRVDCKTSEMGIQVEARDAVGGMFNACYNARLTSNIGGVATLQNKFGFPLVIPMPPGATLTTEDLPSSDDPIEQLRSLFWESQGKLIVEGASLRSMTLPDPLPLPSEVKGELDWAAVAFDLILARMSFFEPEAKSVAADAKTIQSKLAQDNGASGADGFRAAIQKLLKEDPSITALHTFSWIQLLNDAGACVSAGVKGVSALAENPFKDTQEKAQAVSDIASNCSGRAMEELGHSGKVISSVLGSVKVIPEVIQALLAGLLKEVSLNSYDPSRTYLRIETPCKEDSSPFPWPKVGAADPINLNGQVSRASILCSEKGVTVQHGNFIDGACHIVSGESIQFYTGQYILRDKDGISRNDEAIEQVDDKLRAQLLNTYQSPPPSCNKGSIKLVKSSFGGDASAAYQIKVKTSLTDNKYVLILRTIAISGNWIIEIETEQFDAEGASANPNMDLTHEFAMTTALKDADSVLGTHFASK